MVLILDQSLMVTGFTDVVLHTYKNIIVHCAYASSRDVMLGLHAVSSPCVLYSFYNDHLGLESSSRVVYLAGYRFALSVSETAI